MSENTEISFSIPDVVDALDAVPEKFRGLHVEKEGKFAYQDPAVLARSLQNAKRERDEAKKAAASAEAWKRLGKAPEEIEELLNREAALEEERVKKSGDWEAYKSQMGEDFRKRTDKMVAQHTSEVQERDQRIQRLQASLENKLIMGEASAAIAEAKGVPSLLLPHVKQFTKVVEEDGEFVAIVTNAKGEPRVNARGEYLTIKDLVAEWRDSETYSRAFDASGVGGGGAPANSRPGGAGKRTMSLAEFNALSPRDRAARMAAGLTLNP